MITQTRRRRLKNNRLYVEFDVAMMLSNKINLGEVILYMEELIANLRDAGCTDIKVKRKHPRRKVHDRTIA